jgi:hypothetical protein
VAQRIIEWLIGRLVTDEQFRRDFLQSPERTLSSLNEHGLELSRTEMAALLNTDPALWAQTAGSLDVRLLKPSPLKNE